MKIQYEPFVEAIKMRCKNVACIIVAVLLMGGSVHAGKWVAAVADPNLPIKGMADWNIAGNWDTNLVPVSGEKVQFSATNAVGALITAAAECGQLVVGDGGSNPLQRLTIYNGGSLNTYGSGTWAAAGYDSPGAINVERGGAMITEHRLGVGLIGATPTTSVSYLNVNGGLVDITGPLQIGSVNHKGVVTVNSGLLEATGWEWRDTGTPATWSFMDVRHGTVVIGGDQTGAGADDVPALLASGALTGFGGDGTINAVFANGVTTLTANDPLARTPKMDAVVETGDVDLSWVNVGTSPVYVAVWFGTDLANLTMQNDPNDIEWIDKTTFPVNAPSNGEYIWRVDTYDSAPGTDPNDPIVGDTMYFVASDDAPPSIVMDTPPTATWKSEPTTLQVTVKDDGKSAVTVTWSAQDTSGGDAGPIVDPNVVFDPPFTVIPAQAPYTGTGIVVTTTMTVDYHAAQMRATATAADSNPLFETASAVVNLDCADNPCQAARAIGLGAAYPGDITVNCMVNLADFAEIASEWLTNYALTAPAPIAP